MNALHGGWQRVTLALGGAFGACLGARAQQRNESIGISARVTGRDLSCGAADVGAVSARHAASAERVAKPRAGACLGARGADTRAIGAALDEARQLTGHIAVV